MRMRGRLLALAVGVAMLIGCSAPTTPPTSAPTGASPTAVLTVQAPGAAVPAGGPPTAGQPGPPDKVTLAITSPVAAYWPVFIAVQEGFFARERLEVEVLYTQSGVRSVQTLAGGSADIAIPGPDAVLQANARGAQLLLIAGGQHSAPYSMLAQPEIESVAQLKGKTVGASGVKGGNAFVMRRLLEHAGLEPDRDYSLLVVGATPEATAALRARGVDAILALQPQDFQLQDEGFRRIAGAATVLPKYEFVAVASRVDWLRENRAVAVRFLRAMIAAERWFYDPTNRTRAVDILADTARIEPRYAERTYDMYLTDANVIPRAGELDDEALAAVIEGLIQDGELAAPPRRQEYRDDSILAEALR